MKLSSKQIIETLNYSPVKDFKRLLIAVNKHKGIKFKNREALIDACYNGLDGHTGDVVAYELGLSVKGFMPVYRRKKRKKDAFREDTPPCITQTQYGFKVMVVHNKTKHYCGTFSTIKEAVKARDEKCVELGKKPPKSRKYKGVYKVFNRYEARIFIDGMAFIIGRFDNACAAANAYNSVAKFHGRKLNIL